MLDVSTEKVIFLQNGRCCKPVDVSTEKLIFFTKWHWEGKCFYEKGKCFYRKGKCFFKTVDVSTIR